MKKRILSMLLALLMTVGSLIMGIPVSAKLNFNDTDGHWATEAIEYVVENGLMNGVGDGSSFAPNMSLTRGMVVTVLYRANGSPRGGFTGVFLDVKEGTYYAKAAEWAYSNGIVTGTGTDDWGEPYFSPDRDITRQELATMFARYAAFKHVDTKKQNADIASYPDAGTVASWATDSVKWAVGVGLITGKTNGNTATLSPLDKAVRAEFATIIQRYNSKETSFEYNLAYSSPVLKSKYTEPEYSIVDDADVYVAVDGSDKNPGTFDKPLATLEGAKAKVRELKKTAKDEIVVAFKAGNYGKLNNVTFTPEDSGSEKIPVTYCKYGDGDVIFSNGVIIVPSDLSPITDAEKALFPAESGNLIKKISLDGLMPDKFVSTHNYLFSKNNGFCHLARDLNKNQLGQDVYYVDKTTESTNRKQSILLGESLRGTVNSFSTTEGLMVKGMLRCGYLYDRFDVIDYNPETGEMFMDTENWETLMPDMAEGRFDYHGGFAVEDRMDDKIFFYNLAEFMDAEGEYWVDLKTNTLYIYNPDGSYTFCTDGTMMTIEEGADHISFIGLEFNGSDETMVYSNGDYITYYECTFANIGGFYAIKAVGVNHFVFENCESYNFVDGSLFLESDADRTNVIPAGNVIRNNSFHDFGLSEYWSNGVRVKYDVGCIIEHNEFKNGGHGGLRYDKCIDTLIQYNVFDSLMESTEDYGAIYTIWSISHRDNVIRYNLFNNITSYGARMSAATYGIYVDNYSCGDEIYGNVFYNGGVHAVVLHDGRDNKVHDNIFISNGGTLHMSGFGGDVVMYTAGLYTMVENGTTANYSTSSFAKDIATIPQPGQEGYDVWSTRWPILYQYHSDVSKLGEVECAFTTVNTVSNNSLITRKNKGDAFGGGEMLEMFGIAEGNLQFSINENPYFVNPALGDYTLKDGADFFNIPYEKIGRY